MTLLNFITPMISHVQQSSSSCYLQVLLSASSSLHDTPTPSASYIQFPRDHPVVPLSGPPPRGWGSEIPNSIMNFITSHLLFHLPTPTKMHHSCDLFPSRTQAVAFAFTRTSQNNCCLIQNIMERARIPDKTVGECWSDLRANSHLAAPIKPHPKWRKASSPFSNRNVW